MTTENDVIETSANAENESKSGLYPYDPTQADIDIRENPHSIYELLRRYKDGRLIVHPELQKTSWTQAQKSHFIETVILGFPLPPFYVSQTREGKLIIIDGLQRMNALQEFTTDVFCLTGLRALAHLNDKNFTDLKQMPGAYQVKVEDKKIMLYVLKPSTNPIVIVDLLQRVNIGGTALTEQELQAMIELGRSESLEMLAKEKR
jgi:hypothetical protein